MLLLLYALIMQVGGMFDKVPFKLIYEVRRADGAGDIANMVVQHMNHMWRIDMVWSTGDHEIVLLRDGKEYVFSYRDTVVQISKRETPKNFVDFITKGYGKNWKWEYDRRNLPIRGTNGKNEVLIKDYRYNEVLGYIPVKILDLENGKVVELFSLKTLNMDANLRRELFDPDRIKEELREKRETKGQFEIVPR